MKKWEMAFVKFRREQNFETLAVSKFISLSNQTILLYELVEDNFCHTS